jgi:hypothetical protein
MINLVQISDLHFGPSCFNAKVGFLSGFYPHDVVLCKALENFLDEDIFQIEGVTLDSPPFLVMNGDLTSTGKDSEFEVAYTFLFSQHSVVANNRERRVGLMQKELEYAGIPGNHDHWAGVWKQPFQGFSADIYNRFFRPLPYSVSVVCQDGIELCIFSIDSCSIFEKARININLRAIGGFSENHRTSFSRLVEDTLQKPRPDNCQARVAVILCHHPFTRDGAAGPLLTESAKWLGRLAANSGIRLILTGHTHKSWTNPMLVSIEQGWAPLREVRCPTTLQYPAKLDARQRKPGLWLHQLSTVDEGIRWKGKLLLFADDSFKHLVNEADNSHVDEEDDSRRISWFEELMPSL